MTTFFRRSILVLLLLSVHNLQAKECYDQDFSGIVQFICGQGFLSHGGEESLDAQFAGVELEGKSILDIGSGLGGPAFALARRYSVSITGIDCEEDLVKQANAIKEELKGTVSFEHTQDPFSLNQFADESFDIVFSREALLHIPFEKKESFFNEIYRVLKPGGQVVILDWTQTAPYTDVTLEMMKLDAIDYNLSSPDQYHAILERAGFIIEQENDHTSANKGYTHQINETLLENEEDCIAVFGRENYDFAKQSWGLQQQVLDLGEISVIHYVLTKPAPCTKCITTKLKTILQGREDFFSSCGVKAQTGEGTEGVYSFCSFIGFPPANGVIVRPEAKVPNQEYTQALIERFSQRGLPFLWWGKGEDLETYGLMFAGEFSGVCRYLEQPLPSHSCNVGIVIDKVSSDKSMADFNSLFMESAQIESSLLASQLGKLNQAASKRGHQHHFVAYLDDLPVAIATLALFENSAGIWNLFTLPEHRDQGIATELVAYLTELAKEKGHHHLMAILEPEAMAKGVFKHLGFEDICYLPAYLYLPE